jgi:hypothetical protein
LCLSVRPSVRLSVTTEKKWRLSSESPQHFAKKIGVCDELLKKMAPQY